MRTPLLTNWTARRIAECCGGTASGQVDRTPTGMTNDGRNVRPGFLFVALKDQRDGHDFIDQARANGALIFLVDGTRRPEPLADEAVIAVGDTYDALARLGAALWRAHGVVRPDRVSVALTGSAGKTTTKNLIERLLVTAFGDAVLATRGNLNNHIGLPLMMAELSADHHFTVLEMGASKPGDIDQLISMAPSRRALVTTIAPAHLEGFGDLAGVAREKGRIFCGEPAPELGVLPWEWKSKGLVADGFRGRLRTFGQDEGADVRVGAITPGEPQRVELSIALDTAVGAEELTLSLRLPGRHNALNLAAAVAAVHDLLPPGDRQEILAEVAAHMEPTAGRLTWIRGEGGFWVLDDSYNANPASMRVALEVHGQRAGRRWAILGDMLELGTHSGIEHRMVGREAGRLGCARVWAVGSWADELAAGAREGGVDDVAVFPDATSCARELVGKVRAEDVVLVKGSHGVHLEEVVKVLVAEGGRDAERLTMVRRPPCSGEGI